jgi:hypothetical protein
MLTIYIMNTEQVEDIQKISKTLEDSVALPFVLVLGCFVTETTSTFTRLWYRDPVHHRQHLVIVVAITTTLVTYMVRATE